MPLPTCKSFMSSAPLTDQHPQTMADESYLIVGAGVFGASTAFHLIRKYPNATIKLVDREPFPCQLGASWDWNKVIRAEYADLFYMKLALEAKAIWESDPLFKPFYHEAGAVWIADFDLADTISENYAKLGLGDNAMRYTIEEARKIYGGMFDRTEFTGVDRVLVSPRTGWAEASKALVKVIQAAVGKGVTYINASVTSLLFNGTGECVGVHTAGEDNLMASKIVLCTGAYTAKLLADSAPDREDLHAGDRFIAAGMCTALMTPEPDACKHFKDVPIVLHGRINHEGRGGCFFFSLLHWQGTEGREYMLMEARRLHSSHTRGKLQMVGRHHLHQTRRTPVRHLHLHSPARPFPGAVGRPRTVPQGDGAGKGSHLWRQRRPVRLRQLPFLLGRHQSGRQFLRHRAPGRQQPIHRNHRLVPFVQVPTHYWEVCHRDARG